MESLDRSELDILMQTLKKMLIQGDAALEAVDHSKLSHASVEKLDSLSSSMKDQLHAVKNHVVLLRNKVPLIHAYSNRARNRMNLAVSLPPELLSSIFLSTFEVVGSDEHLSMLIPLTSICSIWRKVAIETPCLWTFIHCDWDERNPDSNMNILHLQRSKNAPLRLNISIPYLTDPVLASIAEAPALAELGNHFDIRRVRSLRIQAENEMPITSLQPIEHLDDLVIHQSDESSSTAQTWLDFLQGITFRRLFLDGHDSFSMTPLSATLLTHLYYFSPYHPSIPGFLRSASLLEVLYIHIWPSETEFAPSNDLTPIVLPLLRSIGMEGELRELSTYFIDAPNLTRLAIGALAGPHSLIGDFPQVDTCEVDWGYGKGHGGYSEDSNDAGSNIVEDHPLWRILNSPPTFRRLELKNSSPTTLLGFASRILCLTVTSSDKVSPILQNLSRLSHFSLDVPFPKSCWNRKEKRHIVLQILQHMCIVKKCWSPSSNMEMIMYGDEADTDFLESRVDLMRASNLTIRIITQGSDADQTGQDYLQEVREFFWVNEN